MAEIREFSSKQTPETWDYGFVQRIEKKACLELVYFLDLLTKKASFFLLLQHLSL